MIEDDLAVGRPTDQGFVAANGDLGPNVAIAAQNGDLDLAAFSPVHVSTLPLSRAMPGSVPPRPGSLNTSQGCGSRCICRDLTPGRSAFAPGSTARLYPIKLRTNRTIAAPAAARKISPQVLE